MKLCKGLNGLAAVRFSRQHDAKEMAPGRQQLVTAQGNLPGSRWAVSGLRQPDQQVQDIATKSSGETLTKERHPNPMPASMPEASQIAEQQQGDQRGAHCSGRHLRSA
ncbi:MAG: hypothetical protein ACRERX_15345 [Pseudomonas sp.]